MRQAVVHGPDNPNRTASNLFDELQIFGFPFGSIMIATNQQMLGKVKMKDVNLVRLQALAKRAFNE